MGECLAYCRKSDFKYLRFLLGLKHNVSYERRRLANGIQKIKNILLLRLIEYIKKNIEHFEELEKLYIKTIEHQTPWMS
jgi:hypothetical protein